MARRTSGRALNGWLRVDKCAGPSSADVVNRARWLLQARKAGHAGTLDPAATGLLVVAFGEATKALPLFTDALKTYEFTVRWGASTTTDDAEGEILETRALRPDRDAVEAVLPRFRGRIEQVPPAFSAVKVAGERAYAIARRGEAATLAPRPLHVDALDLLDAAEGTARFRLVCGKGGYVRSIARDMGAALGCLGHVLTLRRTATGPFDVAGAVDWSAEPGAEDLEPMLEPLARGLTALPECRCGLGALGPLRNGNPAEVTWTSAANGDAAWASVEGAPVALGTYAFGTFRPSRVFVFA